MLGHCSLSASHRFENEFSGILFTKCDIMCGLVISVTPSVPMSQAIDSGLYRLVAL